MISPPSFIAPGPDAAATVYWLGSDASLFKAQEGPFKERGYDLIRCGDWDALRARMRDPDAPAPDFLIADLAGSSKKALEISQEVRRSRKGRHLPILFLWEGEEAGPDVTSAMTRRLVDSMPRSMTRELLMMRMRSFLSTIRQFQLHPPQKSASLMASRDRLISLDLKSGICRLYHGLDIRDVPLSRAELAIMAAMLKKSNQVVGLKDFAGHGWTPRTRSPKSQAVAQHIVKLRRKLGSLGERIETIPRRGYRFREPLS